MWGGCWELYFPFGLGWGVESKRGEELLVGGGGEEGEGAGGRLVSLRGPFQRPRPFVGSELKYVPCRGLDGAWSTAQSSVNLSSVLGPSGRGEAPSQTVTAPQMVEP